MKSMSSPLDQFSENSNCDSVFNLPEDVWWTFLARFNSFNGNIIEIISWPLTLLKLSIFELNILGIVLFLAYILIEKSITFTFIFLIIFLCMQGLLKTIKKDVDKNEMHFFIFIIFFFIFFLNLNGMIPYSFAITGQIGISLILGLSSFTDLNAYLIFAKRKFLYPLFWIEEAPRAVGPLLILVEFISYVGRSLSLGIRLFANIMAGHALLKIFSIVVFALILFLTEQSVVVFGTLTTAGIFGGLVLLIIISTLEFAVACLQAYVFTMLISIYYNDLSKGHH